MPSTSTPWLAVKPATAPGKALLRRPFLNVTGTAGSADASLESQGSGVTDVLLASTTFLSVFPAIVTEMGLSPMCVTQGLGLAYARKMWKA
ncbi:hypothetical protein LEMLEM_LOCUS7190 [Lemmus lemmus]